jgi:glyoxylase I family protein
MVTFAGVPHVAFTVTDLDASQRFFTEVSNFVVVMDVGYGRICMHPGTGFTLTLRHEGAHGASFTELSTGLDHLGLVASSRESSRHGSAVSTSIPGPRSSVPLMVPRE